jgi:hypothetical protein
MRKKGLKVVGSQPSKTKSLRIYNMARRGAWGGQQKGKKHEVSSSQGLVNDSRVAREAWMVGSKFKYLCSDKEKKTAIEIKKAIQIQHHNISEEGIFQEVKGWVDDPQYSRTQETKYFKLVETY